MAEQSRWRVACQTTSPTARQTVASEHRVTKFQSLRGRETVPSNKHERDEHKPQLDAGRAAAAHQSAMCCLAERVRENDWDLATAQGTREKKNRQSHFNSADLDRRFFAARSCDPGGRWI